MPRSLYDGNMSHPYDASTKYLIETRLADWLPLCGRTTTAELEIINADLSTVTAAADRVLLVREASALAAASGVGIQPRRRFASEPPGL